MKTAPAVGDIVDARCTKCQKVTNHVVVAMVGPKPAKVQCNTCNGTHRYRQPEAVRQAPKRTSDASVVRPEEWAALEKAKINIAAKDYDMDKDYRSGTMINHPLFGFGLVQRLCGNRKMEVLFDAGKKTMRCK